MYELYYWPGLQGRGELVRLPLEDAGAPYIDAARAETHGGVAALHRMLSSDAAIRGFAGPQPFAPPILKDGSLVISHAANILLYLGPRLGLVGEDERSRHHAHGVQLSVTDLYAEVHDTHHPISSALYYEDQKPEARRRTAAFLEHRLPKFLGWFERTLGDNTDGHGEHLVGGTHSYVDLSLFQCVAGLRYAFPRAMAALEPSYPRVIAVHDRVAERPRIRTYLASERRWPFNEHCVFRRYPELNLEPGEP